MTIVKFMMLALLCAFVIVMLKNISREFAIFASIACSVVLLFFVLENLTTIFYDAMEVFEKAEIPMELLKPCMKVIGLAYLTEFTASITLDAGEKSISDKVKLFGKLSIFASTLPLVSRFINMVVGLI